MMRQNDRLTEVTPLQFAYIGDSVYDLLVRSELLHKGEKLHRMHHQAISIVNAAAQSRTLELLRPHLTEEEADMVRKGRNAHSKHQVPKSASCAEYSAATGLEALFGYLYLKGSLERLIELFELSMAGIPAE